MKIPNNCCQCKYSSELSELGNRYCNYGGYQKYPLSRPAYQIQVWCPILEHREQIELNRQRMREEKRLAERSIETFKNKEGEKSYHIGVKNGETVLARNILINHSETGFISGTEETEQRYFDEKPSREKNKYDLTHKEIFSSLVDVDTVLLNIGNRLIKEYGVNPNYVKEAIIELIDRLYIIRTALNKQYFDKLYKGE